MKLLTASIVALVALVLCAHKTSAGSSTVVGDIIIRGNDENGNLYCDGLICPAKTFSCEVIKRNDPKDFQQIIRVRKCWSEDGKILKDQVVREPNNYQGNVNIHVSSGGSYSGVSRELTPEEEQQLRVYLEGIQSRINTEVEQNLSHLNEALRPLQDGSLAASIQSRFGADFDNSGFNEAMRPFLDGSFGVNLRNRINQEVRDSLRGIYP